VSDDDKLRSIRDDLEALELALTRAAGLCGAIRDRLNPQPGSIAELKERPVSWLDLSERAYRALVHNDIRTIGHLLACNEVMLLRLPNFGRKHLNEIKEALGLYGLSIRRKDEPQELPPDATRAPDHASGG